MTKNRSKSRAKLLRSVYIWHRYIGLAASLFVILLAVTGLALNHTEELELDSNNVQSSTLLNWYGIHAPEIKNSFLAGEHHVSAIGDDIYWDTAKIPGLNAPLIGAVEYSGFIVISTDAQILLFTTDGALIEQLGGAAGVPAGIQSIGLTNDGTLAVKTPQGDYQVNADFLEWHKADSIDAGWARSTELSLPVEKALQASWRGNGLPLERVLLDLHSGRIFGSWGIYLMDTAALLFIMLAITGVWLWGKRRVSARQHRRHIKTRKIH